jgi:hypothetical protein
VETLALAEVLVDDLAAAAGKGYFHRVLLSVKKKTPASHGCTASLPTTGINLRLARCVPNT